MSRSPAVALAPSWSPSASPSPSPSEPPSPSPSPSPSWSQSQSQSQSRSPWLTLALVLVLAVMPAAAVQAADPPPGAPAVAAVVVQPRSFGHVLGDVLTQRVSLDQGGRTLQPGALPAAARIDLWLERRPPRLETDAHGRHWLAIDYQIINSPRTLSAIALPALAVPTAGGPTLQLAAWPISIAPLTPDQPFGRAHWHADIDAIGSADRDNREPARAFER